MKQKKCKSCQKEYTPKKQAQPRCEPCILQAEKDKKFKQLKKQIEKPLKPPKQIKVQPDTQWVELSKAIKERDAGLPCISCGKTMQPYEIQAGHYIARGKSVKLKYEPRNIYAQCWNCNCFLNGNVDKFRLGLIQRYAKEYVDILEEIYCKERKILIKNT